MWDSIVTMKRPSFNFSHFNLLWCQWDKWNKLGMKHLCKVLYKVSSFRHDQTVNMATTGNFYSEWLNFQKSDLKPRTCRQMELNFTVSIYGVSFTKFSHFVLHVLIRLQILTPMGSSCFQWADIKKIVWNRFTNGTILRGKHMWENLYIVYPFHLDLTTNMATLDNSCFWLANISKLLLKLQGQMELNVEGSIYMYVMSFMKFPHFVPISQQTLPP